MTNVDLVHKQLPQELWEVAMTYTIPDKFLEIDPAIIILILNSKSMDTHEDKQSWFSLLPMMNDEQMTKLRDILTREKQKLEEIEAKYDQKKDEVKTNMVQRWEESGYQQKIASIKTNEATAQQKDVADAESLLNQI